MDEPGGARRSQEEPGGARRSQEEPGGARSPHAGMPPKLSQDAAGSSQDEAMDGARIEPGQVQRLEPGGISSLEARVTK